jgi:hypothetical protein
MLIVLTSAASPTLSKIATFVREAFAATPLGIVLQAVRDNRKPARRSPAAVPARSSR